MTCFYSITPLFRAGMRIVVNLGTLIMPSQLPRQPNGEICARLVQALAVETDENWLEQHRYLNMEDLREHKRRVAPRPVQRNGWQAGGCSHVAIGATGV